MILIVGGIFQGKQTFAKRLWEQEKGERAREASIGPIIQEKNGAAKCTCPGPGIISGNQLILKDGAAKCACPGPRIISGNQLILEGITKVDIITDFHLYIRSLLQQEKDAAKETEILLSQNQNLILTLAELGNGIVPMEPFERAYREAVGRIGCRLAKGSEAVYRITCGIEQRIK